MCLPYRHLVWDEGVQQLLLPLPLSGSNDGLDGCFSLATKKAGEWDVPSLLLGDELPFRRLDPPAKLKNEKTYT